jgi:hypothetical protein
MHFESSSGRFWRPGKVDQSIFDKSRVPEEHNRSELCLIDPQARHPRGLNLTQPKVPSARI